MDEFKSNDQHTKPSYTNDHEEELDGLEANIGPQPMLMPDETRDEEMAAEISTFDDDSIIKNNDHGDVDDQVSSVPGWIGLALSVLSFFMMPIIFGGAAIIIGFVARNRGAVWLGNTAIAIGVISIIVRLFFIPFV